MSDYAERILEAYKILKWKRNNKVEELNDIISLINGCKESYKSLTGKEIDAVPESHEDL